VKVLDFGVSKVENLPEDLEPSESLTRTQAMIGSPHYMSPEQLRSARDVDSRTDIWALGASMFKLLTGEPAFDAASTAELCVSILVNPLRSVRAVRPDLPPALEAVIAKCLAKEPENRYPTVGELAAALVAFAPPHSAPSVDRIARVISSSRQLASEPPAGSRPISLRRSDPDLEARTTLGASAAAVPSDSMGSRSLSAAGVPRARGWSSFAIGASVLMIVAGGVAFGLSRMKPAPAPAVAPPLSASVESPVTVPAVSIAVTTTHPAPPASIAASATTAASATSTAPPIAARQTRGGVPRASAHPSVAAPPPPPPPPDTGAVPDFGGRK
jgi:serine/threonine-protein kinase